MENNDFLTPDTQPQVEQKWEGATIRSLRLKPVVTVKSNAEVSSAIEIMRDKGYDQLPVLNNKGKLVGLVTLGNFPASCHSFPYLHLSFIGNLLSYISRGRATASTSVSEVMFNFTKIKEVVTDPTEIGSVRPSTSRAVGGKPVLNDKVGNTPSGMVKKRRYDEITVDTPLSALSRFCKSHIFPEYGAHMRVFCDC